MKLLELIRNRDAKIGIIGLGYVGLPLLIEFVRAGFNVTGFDIDEAKVCLLKEGKSYLKHIDVNRIKQFTGKQFLPTSDFSGLADMDCIIICVPTPLNKYREPDLTYVFNSTRLIGKHLKKGQLIVLESTTYPGTTSDDVRAILDETGLVAGVDYYLAYSAEREDPNNTSFSTSTIPKVVSGHSHDCLVVAQALYDTIIAKTIAVSSTKVAEAAKLLENIYRAVNIALVNEMKMLFDAMDIDVWEVIEAAKTKPFGFHAFYPGPGLGGHCIPIDPFYLTWKARQYDFPTRFIELAGEINTHMPFFVVEKVRGALNQFNKSVKGSKILVLGVAYKKDIDDQRESPALKIIQLLIKDGAEVCYNDPYVGVCRGHRHYPDIDMTSVELTAELLKESDLVLLITDHSVFDYAFIEQYARCIIVDTRDAFRRNNIRSDKIYRA
ncbi:nucleotide sugar dehydrogenase [Candidatus Magnetobacterium casense]|uniref:Nucleotide sugar dehydrogenase n=1 Tax=Candidatus Magnetobacterium casense TaxID=1455061 RepID=A0ABS6S030_9BACT|nr:nucleotide sugar dehydrogenase [Candidatus Magnetobacterium casensis]MBV6341935.1 nucleotide sugar dehydrogenase [Candidatus Magnetobacterium casensis]